MTVLSFASELFFLILKLWYFICFLSHSSTWSRVCWACCWKLRIDHKALISNLWRDIALSEEPGQHRRCSDWLRAGRPRGQSSSPGRVNNFLFSASSRPTVGFIQPRLSALRAGRFLLPEKFLAIISLRGWVDPKAIVRLEGFGKLKKSTSSGTRTGDLPDSSTVPQPTTLSRATIQWVPGVNRPGRETGH
jgi:hypothetical protein